VSFRDGENEAESIHVNVACTAGAHTIGSSAFFHYILRLVELELPLASQDQEAVEILAAIPHAFETGRDGSRSYGSGWRVIPAHGELDWAVLEATPERLHSALERARGILWQNAAQFHVSAREITTIEDELEAVYGLLMRAKAAGVPVNVSYVA
jgi:hypothetical protein